jgi:hypothetical protein
MSAFAKRGQGLYDRISGAPSLEQLMDDVRAVMDAVGSKRAAVSEFSLIWVGEFTDRLGSISLVTEDVLRKTGLQGKGWWQPGWLPTMRLLTGRLVCATKLTCLLPNLLNFVLRPQARELYIVEGAAPHDNANHRRRCTGVRHIDDHQHAGAIGSVAIHRDQFATGGFASFWPPRSDWLLDYP